MQASEPYVTIDTVATHFAVSISTIRAWIRGGRIAKNTFIKAGNTYRFKLSKVETSLNEEVSEEPTTEPIKLYPTIED